MEYEIYSLVHEFLPSFTEQSFTNKVCCASILYTSFPFILTIMWSSFLPLNRVLWRGRIWATWGIHLMDFIAHKLSTLANSHLPNPCWLVVMHGTWWNKKWEMIVLTICRVYLDSILVRFCCNNKQLHISEAHDNKYLFLVHITWRLWISWVQLSSCVFSSCNLNQRSGH